MATTTRERRGRLRRFNERFLVEERVVPASARRGLQLAAVGLVVVGLVGFLVVFDSVAEADDLSRIDAPVEAWLQTGRSDWLTVVMSVIAVVFGPVVMPIIIVITTVAWGVLAWRWRRPRARFVIVPLDLRDPHGLAALAMVTTVVPGTVWSEIALDCSALLLHVWDVEDEAAFVTSFKARYEAPLREIFE